jgi:hypothetical protein
MCRKQGERAILGQTFLARKKQRVPLKSNLINKTSGQNERYVSGIEGKKEKSEEQFNNKSLWGIYIQKSL